MAGSGRLAGKVALILGAAGKDNMGQVLAQRFAREGAKVMVAGRHESPLCELAAKIEGAYVTCDITVETEITEMIARTVARFGGLDIAVNTTGWGLLKPFLETSREELERMTALQFIGPFQFMQAAVKAMARGGSIIQISSATATIMLDHHAAYMGTKAGTDHVVRCIANEFGERGIRVNSISPGLTASPMTGERMQSEKFVEVFRKEYPLGRIGTLEDVAQAAVWLASDESFMTGQNLQINGGLTLRRNPRRAEIDAALRGA
ncbi:MAG: SDR family oxidoreductase [Rhodospirillaceae bacterium]|nr:MAG: SDR family oxidoreductase [Rhodospirillaceae bacterium]